MTQFKAVNVTQNETAEWKQYFKVFKMDLKRVFISKLFFISKHLWIKKALKRIICQYLYSIQTVFLSINHNVYRLYRAKNINCIIFPQFEIASEPGFEVDAYQMALSANQIEVERFLANQSTTWLASIWNPFWALQNFNGDELGRNINMHFNRCRTDRLHQLHLRTLQNIDEDPIRTTISQVQASMNPHLNTIFTLLIKLKDKIYNTFVK